MTDKTIASRRIVLRAGAVALAAAGVGLARQASAQQKIQKAMVMYQEQPKDGQQCDKCTHWQAPNACAIVEGTILPTGWCGAFAPKA